MNAPHFDPLAARSGAGEIPAAESPAIEFRGEALADDPLVLGKHRFRSRLIVGTGKYADFEIMRRALEESGAEMITVAVRRVDFSGDPSKNLLNYIDRGRYAILPNTAGCYNAEEAIRVACLGRELGISDLVKLEVLGDPRTLLPDPIETLKATERLVKDGFTVLVYTTDDPIMARRLQDAGATSVMPAGSPIGSGQGVLNPNNIRIILESVTVPVIVDAGVGTASDVAVAMELGVAGVLLNTGIALAREPVRMARAMRLATQAGRDAFLAGRIPRRLYASASSPLDGVVR
ncbi:MAG: thiazole synthase [Planctomycetes bacterium]|nr:thiazole synthase [Planctomycetota bacterium]